VHHHHLVGHVFDHGQIVRDEDVGQAQLILQILQQIQHLRLHRHVQRRNGFVADQDFRLQVRQRAMAMRCRWPPENSCG
jgi:hypothetical protein